MRTADVIVPKEIYIRYGDKIDSIQVTYLTKPNGKARALEKRGGTGGKKSCEFKLNPDENIVKVRGVTGDVLTGLQFYTDMGRKSTYCGHDTVKGSLKAFNEEHPGHVLSYISGSYGKFINSITLHWLADEARYIMSSIKYDLTQLRQQINGSPVAVYLVQLNNHSPIEQSVSATKTITATDSQMWSVNTATTVREL